MVGQQISVEMHTVAEQKLFHYLLQIYELDFAVDTRKQGCPADNSTIVISQHHGTPFYAGIDCRSELLWICNKLIPLM